MRAELEETWTITEVTREFGVSTRTLRFYEDEGLVKPIRRGRTRLYRRSDRTLLGNILRGKRLGFSIAEIREIMSMYRAPSGEEKQLETILARIAEKRTALEQKRADIDELLNDLENAEETMLTRMAELGIGRRRRA